MSFQANKYDFEKALDGMEAVADTLNGIISDENTEALFKVISEYTGHFQNDVEELEKERDELQSKIDEIRDRVS